MVGGTHEECDHLGVEHSLDWFPVDVGDEFSATQAGLKRWTPLVNILVRRGRLRHTKW